jgi:hypothetical protein
MIYLTQTSTYVPRYTSTVWLAGQRGQRLMADNPYPETGITEETRHMYSDGYSENYNKVFKQFIDDILVPAPPMRPRLTMRIDRLDNHEILLDELELMYEAHMTIGGQQNRFNASVLRAAINVIKAL